MGSTEGGHTRLALQGSNRFLRSRITFSFVISAGFGPARPKDAKAANRPRGRLYLRGILKPDEVKVI